MLTEADGLAMPPTEHQRGIAAMMRQIRADPGDQTVRLVLADYLADFYPTDPFGQRLEAALRQGKVRLLRLDLLLVACLGRSIHGVTLSGPDQRWRRAAKLWQWTYPAAGDGHPPMLPDTLARCWLLAWRYRRQITDRAIGMETHAVQRLRRDLLISRQGPAPYGYAYNRAGKLRPRWIKG